MIAEEAVLAVLVELESGNIPYLVVGALAYSAYGIPRSTKDADFVLVVTTSELEMFFRGLPAAISVDPQVRMELFTGTFRWILNVAGIAFMIELFLLGGDPHHQEMFRRKRSHQVPFLKREAWIPSAEDMVIQKLRWARPKDLDDARNILAVQGDAIDYEWIESWCARHGTSERLAAVRASLLPDL
jgi:hypothetical protein